MIFRFVSPILLITIMSISLVAQEGAGLIYGKYNGLNASKINPSYLLKSSNLWEVQLAGAHIYFENDYAGIYQSNMINILQNIEGVIVSDRAYDDNINAQPLDVIFNSKNQKTFVDLKAEVLGPGGYVNINDKLTLGVSTKLRSFFTARDIPSSLNYYNVIDLPTDSIFELNPFQSNAMVWSEYALHYAQQILPNLNIGASLKYLNGYKAFSIDNNMGIDYVERADTLMALDKGQTHFRYSELEDDDIDLVGSGFGIDLGININNNDGSFLGISILDLGWVNMNGKDYLIDYEAGQSILYPDYDFVTTIDQQIGQMIQDGFRIDSTESYTMILPTALSFQYQKSIDRHWSVEGHWVHRVELGDNQIRRPNSLSFSGVYETKHFSAFLPITMYEY
ncbi:MAG: hypothetical protein HKN51_16305, partial [Saprospiraceae bacterium]|nr:hypothetical protein [Saprospiraceae bacterium]